MSTVGTCCKLQSFNKNLKKKIIVSLSNSVCDNNCNCALRDRQTELSVQIEFPDRHSILWCFSAMHRCVFLEKVLKSFWAVKKRLLYKNNFPPSGYELRTSVLCVTHCFRSIWKSRCLPVEKYLRIRYVWTARDFKDQTVFPFRPTKPNLPSSGVRGRAFLFQGFSRHREEPVNDRLRKSKIDRLKPWGKWKYPRTGGENQSYSAFYFFFLHIYIYFHISLHKCCVHFFFRKVPWKHAL